MHLTLYNGFSSQKHLAAFMLWRLLPVTRELGINDQVHGHGWEPSSALGFLVFAFNLPGFRAREIDNREENFNRGG